MKRVEVAAAVIERPDGAFLMASRPPGKVYAGWWEFPGGKVEAGESARQALDRELKEELGITVTHAHPWLNRAFEYEHASVMLRFFRVTGWTGDPHPHEGQEQLAWVIDPARPDVAPILPANGPILKGLSLPLVLGISAVAELGEVAFLRRLQAALDRGLRLVQWREKTMNAENQQRVLTEVALRCREAGARLLVNGDPALARQFDAGLHLPSAPLMALAERPGFDWVGASCHDERELDKAAQLELDYVLLGPVQPTASHPGAPSLGWARLAQRLRDYPLPVFALGGLTGADLEHARSLGAHGVALKRGAWPEDVDVSST